MSETTPFVDVRCARVAPAVKVRLDIEPNEQLTTEWLRQLIATAREWARKQKEAA